MNDAAVSNTQGSLVSKEALERAVAGALRATVAAHGPIVWGSWIGSATKRIVGQVLADTEVEPCGCAYKDSRQGWNWVSPCEAHKVTT